MNKKIVVLLILILLAGCGNNNQDISHGCDLSEECSESMESYEYMTFKEAYEALNGQSNSSGKAHRNVQIAEDNPFVKVSIDEIVTKIENNETFYVYFGDELCPWCRSVIEKAIEVSKAASIDTIYYVKTWDEEGNEIFRDIYEITDGKPVEKQKGTEAYYKILKYASDHLDDYQIDEISTGEKRIYIPLFLYIENGKVLRSTEGISEYQEDSRQELSEEILNDEERMFKEFFGL